MTVRLSPALSRLIEELRAIPGLGPRSAQRAAFALMAQGRLGRLAQALECVEATVHRCPLCNTYTELPVCEVCADEKRSRAHLCVVEGVGDLMALDASLSWGGVYYVLDGRMSPADGRGPSEIGLERLLERVDESFEKGEPLAEVVVATSYTPEGDATAYYLIQALKKRRPELRVTRLPRGLPSGIEIEYTDLNTIANAVRSRTKA